jgi:peroxiredoxin
VSTLAIDIGTEAPDFTIKTQDEREWRLSDHRGRNVVLLWYPLDWSPCWETSKGIKHDLLADPMLEVTRLYDLAHPAVPFISQRATVVVDKQGRVAFCQVQEKTPEERNWQELQGALEKLS